MVYYLNLFQHPKKTYLLNKAREDLKIWLYYADSSTLEEFFKKADEIKNQSWHKYDDVIKQISYIEKLESKLNV